MAYCRWVVTIRWTHVAYPPACTAWSTFTGVGPAAIKYKWFSRAKRPSFFNISRWVFTIRWAHLVCPPACTASSMFEVLNMVNRKVYIIGLWIETTQLPYCWASVGDGGPTWNQLTVNPCRPTAELFVSIFHSFEAGNCVSNFQLQMNKKLYYFWNMDIFQPELFD